MKKYKCMIKVTITQLTYYMLTIKRSVVWISNQIILKIIEKHIYEKKCMKLKIKEGSSMMWIKFLEFIYIYILLSTRDSIFMVWASQGKCSLKCWRHLASNIQFCLVWMCKYVMKHIFKIYEGYMTQVFISIFG